MQNEYKNCNNVIASSIQSSDPNAKIYKLKKFSIGLIIFTASVFITFTYFQFFDQSHRDGVILNKNPPNNLDIHLFIM